MVKDDIKELITERGARVGVIGLGYVGLPLLVEFARNGFDATGFEVDEAKTTAINKGHSYIGDVPSTSVGEMVEQGRLRATLNFEQLKSCDAIIICVPTPLRKTKEPDVSYIMAAAEEIKRTLRRGQLIVLESTTYPGTTDEVLLPMFEETGLKLDEDFLLAFSPERVDPGNPQFQTHNIPKVVGGCTDDSTEAAAHLYSQIVRDVHAVSSARVAEAAKLLENTFRAVNIGMANEMARLCYALNIDTWEVIRAAATKPFGFMPFYPGPGIGGHCLVGHEMAVVRSSDGLEQVKALEAIFDEQSSDIDARKFQAGGGDVIYKPRLKALSLDLETQQPQWKPIQYLFRRKTEGQIVSVTTSDNRRLTVTDQHPMLVCDDNGAVRQVFARDLKEGDRLPIHLTESRRASASKTFKQAGHLTTVPIKSIEIKTDGQPIEVYSIEVEDTHTFATSYGIYVHNCIPLDPHYLSWKARQHGFDSRFIGLAEEVNSRMPEHVVQLVSDGLNDAEKPLKNSRVLLLGVAYKKDVNDVRESPALSIIDLLRAKGARVSYHDPFVAKINFDDAHTESAGEPLSSITLSDEELRTADCVVIVTDHSQINYRRVTELAPLVVDTRNALNGSLRRESRARIIRL